METSNQTNEVSAPPLNSSKQEWVKLEKAIDNLVDFLRKEVQWSTQYKNQAKQ